MTERPQLAETLRRAVPDPPPMPGLAARAASDARRSRARRRTAVGAVVLVLVAVATSLAVESRTPQPVAGDPVVPTPVGAVSCRAEAPRRDASGAEPVSVRFCPVAEGDEYRAALVPRVALTTSVAATVAELDEAALAAARAFCPTVRNPYRIQIGYADGRAEDLSSDDCDHGYAILLRAIGRQEAADAEPVAPSGPSCSATPLRATESYQFGSPESLGDVRRLPAVQATRCSLSGDVMTTTPVSDPESVRVALLSDYHPGQTDCPLYPQGTLTIWAIRLADGSTHHASVDGRACVPVVVDDVYIGMAGASVVRQAGLPRP